MPEFIARKDRFTGCLLGGAVGDALGAPVEFLRRTDILRDFGPEGITDIPGNVGNITDDTQMTLFTAEGLLRQWVSRVSGEGLLPNEEALGSAYQRWLATQGIRPKRPELLDDSGWLFQQRALHDQRAPGNTCLTALIGMRSWTAGPENHSKGCGGVMRAAPIGLMFWNDGREGPTLHGYTDRDVFEAGLLSAGLTHGHPTGQYPAAILAILVAYLVSGASLPDALMVARLLANSNRHAARAAETLRAIEQAERLAASDIPPEQAIAQLGQGWVAEEALAIAAYCALVARDFRHGVILAVNHDGDSDSTGSITGNLLGAKYGIKAIPQEWLDRLELREVITEVAEDLHDCETWPVRNAQDAMFLATIQWKYPGHRPVAC